MSASSVPQVHRHPKHKGASYPLAASALSWYKASSATSVWRAWFTTAAGMQARRAISACESHRAFIEAQLQLRRNAMAVYQNLMDRHGFAGSGSNAMAPNLLSWRPG